MDAHFPVLRLRRLRQAPWIRKMVQEHYLRPENLIYPLFVHGELSCLPIVTMPGIVRHSMESLAQQARAAQAAGIAAIALFPVIPPVEKDMRGSLAEAQDSLITRAIACVREAAPALGVIADVALDPYTSHGHDGVLDEHGNILNDATVAILCRQAVVLAQAGATVVAPSDMMDGRVVAIRHALDAAGFPDVMIMSYAAKYASAFYGPFRDAVGSAQQLQGDKKTYQMNPANAREALREVQLDVAEGADMLIIKPAMPYLDIIRQTRDQVACPVIAYQVSGEYAMLHAAAKVGAIPLESAMLESLLACKRAGADAIITYAALDVANAL